MDKIGGCRSRAYKTRTNANELMQAAAVGGRIILFARIATLAAFKFALAGDRSAGTDGGTSPAGEGDRAVS
jgi:hypothetical protein